MIRLMSIVGWCVLILNLPGVAGETYQPGDRVVVIQAAQLRVDANAGEEVWPGLVLKVERVNGRWLWLGQGKPGWLDQSNVMPLDRRAIDRLTALIRAKPNEASLYSGRANVWSALGDIDIAISDMGEAIRLSPQSAAYNNRGRMWLEKPDDDQAIADFKEALRLDPKNASAHNNRGLAWNHKGEYDQALADFNEAVRLDPQNAFYYANRGKAWFHKNELDKALADDNEAIRLHPSFANAYLGRGLVWFVKRAYDKSIADLTEVLRLDPANVTAYSYRAKAWVGAGNADKALADVSEALRLDSKCVDAYVTRSGVYVARMEYDQALAAAAAALRLAPRDSRALTASADAYLGRAAAWRDKHQYRRAVADYDEVLRLTPQTYGAYVGRGVAHGELGEFAQALADLDQAARLAKEPHHYFYEVRARVWVAQQEFDKALADYDTAIRLAPSFWTHEILLRRGDVWFAKAAYEKAVADYNEALRLDARPQESAAYFKRGRAWAKLGEYAKALADFQESLAARSNLGATYGELARILATCPEEQFRDAKQALALATQAVEMDPSDPIRQDTLAAACAAGGDFARAVAAQQAALRLASADLRQEFETRLRQYEVKRQQLGTPPDDHTAVAQTPLPYETLLAQVQGPGPRADYGALRLAFANTPQYAAGADQALRERMGDAWKRRKYTEAVKAADEVLTTRFVDAQAHRVAADARAALGQAAAAKTHWRYHDGLVHSILRSGDGKSPATAFVVIDFGEAFALTEYLNLVVREQRLQDQGGKKYCEFQVTSDSQREPLTIYFDISLFQAKVANAVKDK